MTSDSAVDSGAFKLYGGVNNIGDLRNSKVLARMTNGRFLDNLNEISRAFYKLKTFRFRFRASDHGF